VGKLWKTFPASIAQLAEGIVLNSVYTRKAFARLLDLVGNGRFTPNDHVSFLHTGGLPGLRAYAEKFHN
jgi:1-aminocyclopropane-1-carboxylate deaminase/D-cysteine desulfhydrase-like pyridoxal-dependent ACC family enzyme